MSRFVKTKISGVAKIICSYNHKRKSTFAIQLNVYLVFIWLLDRFLKLMQIYGQTNILLIILIITVKKINEEFWNQYQSNFVSSPKKNSGFSFKSVLVKNEYLYLISSNLHHQSNSFLISILKPWSFNWLLPHPNIWYM